MDKPGVAVGQVNHQIYFPIPHQPEETMHKTLWQCVLPNKSPWWIAQAEQWWKMSFELSLCSGNKGWRVKALSFIQEFGLISVLVSDAKQCSALIQLSTTLLKAWLTIIKRLNIQTSCILVWKYNMEQSKHLSHTKQDCSVRTMKSLNVQWTLPAVAIPDRIR